MKPLLLLAALLVPPPALSAPAPAQAQADWRREDIDDRVKAGLASLGWRLEDDGRALDPRTKAPASKPVLDKAVLDLRQGARRAALETANLLLSTGKPLGDEERAKIETLAADLPPGLAAAILDPKSDMNKVKALAEAGLAESASYFDGGRTLADRRDAARPVAAGTPGPRADLPYYTRAEQAAGEKLQASARSVIGRDPFGKTVLSRLGGALPPILIEDQGGGVAATYDYRRRAVVLDREAVLSSVAGTVPPRQAAALRASLSTRAALLSYLEAHPEAAEAVAREQDVLLVHELTHAWQDRRDPIFREMARGNLPDVQPLEYEEEAWKTKNLYLQSKIEHDPASVAMDQEFSDYILMSHGADSWRLRLFNDLSKASPSRALDLSSAESIQAARLARVRTRAVATSAEQEAKALDMLAFKRGAGELAALKAAHAARMKTIDAELDASAAGRSKRLGTFYLGRALSTARATDRAALLDQAERYARASGNATLIEEVRKAKDQK